MKHTVQIINLIRGILYKVGDSSLEVISTCSSKCYVLLTFRKFICGFAWFFLL